MSINVKMQLYRGTLANLSALASTGAAGVLALTTDTNELYIDAGSGAAGIGAGKAWQKVAQDLVDVNAQVGTTYTVLASDRSKLVTLKNASPIAVTLPQAGAAFPVGWNAELVNQGAGTVTITPTTSTIDGAASLTLSTNQGVNLISDGTNYFTVRGAAAIPTPTANTIGGVKSLAAVAHNFLTSIGTDGSVTQAQPAFTDVSGAITQTQLPASIGSGSNLTSVDCGTF